MNIAHYSLLLINPTIDRLDTVVGGAVFHRVSGWEVRIANNAQKMRAINPSFSEAKLSQISQLTQELTQNVSSLPALQESFQGARLGVLIDKFVGTFAYASDTDYQAQVRAVLAESVNPPTIAQTNVSPISRRRNVVRRKLRDDFQSMGLWSRNGSDINNHQVVELFPISADHGIVADFALQNTVMHITETIDFLTQSSKSKKLEAQAKTFVLTEAVKVFGPNTAKYVVAAGSNDPDVRQSVNLLADHAEVFALESAFDMRRYVEVIATAANRGDLV